MQNKYNFGIITLIIVLSASIFLLGFNKNINENPIIAYNVYLDGTKIGVISSKETFENYINSQEENLKKLYGVDNIYTPKGVEIKKVKTYSSNIDSEEVIYRKLVNSKDFTIKGVTVTVKNTEDTTKKDLKINVLSKKLFDDALTTTVKAFVDLDKYTNYMNSTQEEIIEYGSLIENIDLKEKVTYKENYISTDEKIFTDVDELSKYLLYGTLDKQTTYIVKEGDTISDIADSYKLNVKEFLIANPQFTSENNLLYESQEVIVGLIDPIISVIVEVHSVEESEKKYETEIQYDSDLAMGTEYVEREGENGLYKVTKKYQYINGQAVDIANISSTEIKPAVNRVVVKGDKYVPDVADLSYWSWPTDTPYSITSYFAYRWGTFHNAIDIYVGFGSNIYVANNGTVVSTSSACSPGNAECNGGRGNFVIVNHNAGNYYTIYMHLNTVSVNVGQTVSRGQKIATMGNTGYVVPSPTSYNPYGGTHLHFGVFIGSPDAGGTAINPLGLY